MAQAPLRGIIAASITPFAPDGKIDTARLARHIEVLLEDGCSFVSTFGTSGEGASLSTREKIEALSALRGLGVDMARQVPAVMTSALDEAAGLLDAIARAGCRAALILPPFYYPATEDGIVGYFDALLARASAAASLDLMLYNIPQLSRVRFTPSLVARLTERHPRRFVGIKDSTGDLEGGKALVRAFPDLAIMTGDDRVLPDLVAAGGAGMIGGMPNIFARELVRLYKDPKGPEAAALHAQQSARIVAVDSSGSLLALKAAVAYYRDDSEYARARPPLVALSDRQQAALIAAFERSGYPARR